MKNIYHHWLTESWAIGTVVADLFHVIEKTPLSIILRGCLGPVEDPIQPRLLDNLFRLEAELDEEQQEAVFKLKAITLNGSTDRPIEDPFGGLLGIFHLAYSKMLVESAVANCVR
jgi:hypothetical protein